MTKISKDCYEKWKSLRIKYSRKKTSQAAWKPILFSNCQFNFFDKIL